MTVHCYPLNDEQLHELDVTCWCEPTILWNDDDGVPLRNGPVVKHHAADCREIVEELTGESWTADKRWEHKVAS